MSEARELNLDGDLRSIQLSKILLVVASYRASGILTVQGEDDIVAVSFVEGAMVTADALNQTVEEGIGRVLQKQGVLSADQFATASRDYQGGAAGSFGDLLVERGLVDRAALLEALRIQTLRLMLQILTWRQGEYKFYSGDEVSFEDGFVPITVSELLIHAVERLGEKVGLIGQLPDIERTYRRVPPRGQVQVMSEDGDGGVGIWITPDQKGLLLRLDGRQSAAEVGRELGLRTAETQYGLYHLLQFDLVEAVGKGASAPGADESVFSLNTADLGLRPPAGERAADPALAEVTIDPADDTAVRAEKERLKAEIFMPPSPGEIEARKAHEQTQETRVPAYAGALLRWIGPALAVLLAVGLAAGLVLRPSSMLLPFSWQENQRSTIDRQIRQSVFQRIDRAARTYFLMEAHYPDRLADLVSSGLVSDSDLRDPAGYELDYATDALSYRVRLRSGNQQIEGLGAAEAITGDFLVDPQFLSAAANAQAPLVLLD
ncbi:MAG: DUF4388 domain-containing protein [Acidobacteriota bacterium]